MRINGLCVLVKVVGLIGLAKGLLIVTDAGSGSFPPILVREWVVGGALKRSRKRGSYRGRLPANKDPAIFCWTVICVGMGDGCTDVIVCGSI